jgi:hypothetical protein
MQATFFFRRVPLRWSWTALISLGMAVSALAAADVQPVQTNAVPEALTNAPTVITTNAPASSNESTNAPAAEANKQTAPALLTPEQFFEGGANKYNNWIDLSAGGVFMSGNKAAFQQRHQIPAGAYGGIEDFHYQGDISKGTTLTIDGRALFDEHDYKLSLDVTKEKLGYVRFGYREFRTWENGAGGYYPPTGQWYPLSDNALELDRGDLSFEAGLRLDKVPKITFRYDHTFRDGQQDSTIWGQTHPDLANVPGAVRGISPTFLDINEHSDIFQLDATHHIKATDLGLGLRYETTKLDDATKIDQFPGEPLETKITDRQETTYDLFSVHAFSETWIKKNVMLSAGASYSDMNGDISGSRIYGSDFDVGYVPSVQNGMGYFNLSGSEHVHDYVADLNLFTVPINHLTVVPSLRVQEEDWNADSTGMETLGDATPVPFSSQGDRNFLDVRERLDLTYNGITNWVFYGRGEWMEGQGNLNANGGLIPITPPELSTPIGVPPVQQQTDDNQFRQKYSLGVRWYPLRHLTLDAGGYYKLNHNNYSFDQDSTPNNSLSPNRYPAYLVMQDFETYDGNFRFTFRPAQNVTLVGRYEYQWSTIHTGPDAVSGLSTVESSTMLSHIIAGDVTWTPWSRLYLQAGVNYVLSDTKTPASDVTQAVLNAQNNYWTVNFSGGFVVDDKTDFNLSYFYYQADNYQDNSIVGLPLGAGADEHGITATLSRRLTKHVRLALNYGFFHYSDETSGYNNNYNANVLYASLRYRF